MWDLPIFEADYFELWHIVIKSHWSMFGVYQDLRLKVDILNM